MSEDVPPALAEALICLTEEGLEVGKCCTKILRFGVGINPYTGVHNVEELEIEIADFVMLVGVLHAAGVIDTDRINERAEAKLDRVTAVNDGRFKHLFRYPERQDADADAPETADTAASEASDDEGLS